MYESKIEAAPLRIVSEPGFPPVLDRLSAEAGAGYGFLRAAWFRAGAEGCGGGRTLTVSRDGGRAMAAIPTIPFGPRLIGARKVPGSYWPFRSALVAPGCDPLELAQALAGKGARALGPAFRIGPVRLDSPAAETLAAAARQAGWQVLVRPGGTVWLIDLDALRAAGWPGARTARRMRVRAAKLAEQGKVGWRIVRGSDWSEAALAEMGRVEAESWIARTTDGSGAKFMTAAQRALWAEALGDPVLAGMLCATILTLDDRPVAFSFDCDDGAWQYSIAGSYAEDMSEFAVGKIVNQRVIADAITDGQSVLDMGTGDSGYKRDMGAERGYDLADLLFVRNPLAARLLRGWWERPGKG